MSILKPPRLKKGDLIAVAAPASPPASHEKLYKGVRHLEQLGYAVVLGKHVEKKYGYLAGSDKDRANDVNSFFSNPRVKAIFLARGGYGSHRILPLLDYPTLRRNPKILVGYSDITALQLALFKKIGLVTFSGPMVATGFGNGFDGAAEEQFWRCLTSTKPLGVVRNPNRQKLKMMVSGVTVGRLLGGNLSLITALLGTPYCPAFDRCILALEEIEEPPYKIDRMLNHLKLVGVLSRGNGIVMGEFTDCKPLDRKKPSLTLSQVFHDVIVSSGIPAVHGLHYGHVKDPLTLPLGVKARLSAGRGLLEILEPAVE